MTLQAVPAESRRTRWLHVAYAATAAVLLGIAVFSALVWYASTPKFAARVNQELVITLERATGGRVEIRSFRWSVRHLAIEVEGLTIHGKETPDQVPYLHVDHLTAHVKIISFFTFRSLPKISLASLTAEHPTFHWILYPDGTTNQPQPRAASTEPLPQILLSLSIDNTRIQDGLILLNGRAVPWNMAAGPLQLTMRYVAVSKEYQAVLETQNLTFRLKNATEAHSQLQATIDLRRDAVQVENLDLKTGSSQLVLTGELQDFSHPKWRMSVHGSADAREIGAIGGIEGLRNGALKLAIDAHGEANAAANPIFQVSGHIDLRSGQWESPWLRLRNVELHTGLLVDNDQCSLMNFSSVLEDQSRIDGSLIMKHCVGPSAPQAGPLVHSTPGPAVLQKSKSKANHRVMSPREFLAHLHGKHNVQSTTAKIEESAYHPLEADLQANVSNVTLPLILAAVAPRPDWNIGFTTATSGKVTARWTGEGNGLVVRGILNLHAPRNRMGLIPVSGPARAAYLGDNHHLVIDQADLSTPGTQVHASGMLALREKDLTSALQMDVVGHDLGEFDRVLTVADLRATPAGEAHDLPVVLLGSAMFHGVVGGSFFALQATGHMDSQRFKMILAQTAPALPEVRPSTLRTHALIWDQFHADLSYTPSHLIIRDGVLVRGNMVLHTALNLLPDRTAPDTYTYNRHTHIVAAVRTNHASVADVQSILDTSYPLSGALAANAHMAGTVDDLQGAGQIILTDGVMGGEPIPKAFLQLAAHGHEIEATQLQLAATGGSATGELSYDYETDALHGKLTGQGFALEKIEALQAQRLPIGGTVDFHVEASGTAKSPIATGALQIMNLTLNQVSMGRLHAEAHLQDGILHATSRADLMKTHLDAGGQIQLGGNYPAQLELTFAGFNIDPLLRMMAPSGLTGESSLQGRITLSGPIRQPSAIQADADLNAFAATINNLPIHSAGPLEVTLRGGRLQLKQVHILGKDIDVSADGTMDLLQDQKLRLHAEGSMDVALAGVINRNIQSSGQIHFAVDARGTLRDPDLRGRAQMNHVAVHLLNVTNGLTDMNGEMVFDQDRLVIQKLKGNSGGGQLEMQGFVGYRSGVFVDLTANTKEVRIRYPKGVSSSMDAKLRLLGTTDSLLLSGNVEMMRFGIASTVDLASLAGGATSVSPPTDPSSLLNRVRLDVHVTSAPELGFQNSFASLAGDVNLRVRGTLENPSVLGRIDIAEGSASFAGTKYRLQQGDIIFSNPVTIAPQIDLEASARVQNYNIIISLHGPPSKLDISYRSEPPLTQADVLALLALGRTNEQAAMYGEQQQAGANLTSEALLGGALNAAVSSRVEKLFGVGSVRVDPNFVGALGESTARVTVEEQVGRDLTLTFATNVNTTAQQLIQAQYDLTQNVSIIAVRDEADVFSMYLQIRGRHK